MQDAIILYENGKAIGGEGHPTDADDITFDNTGTDIVANKVGSAIKEVNAKTSGLMKLSVGWTNPNITATFSAQTITLNSTDWDFILIMFDDGSNGGALSQITTKGKVTRLIAGAMSTSGNSQMQTRSATVSADGSSIAFTSAYRTYVAGSGAESGVNDGFCKPIAVYLIKII